MPMGLKGLVILLNWAKWFNILPKAMTLTLANTCEHCGLCFQHIEVKIITSGTVD